jgi:hypothetical protein
MKKPTYKELERKVKELEALSATNARRALREVKKAGDCLMASAVIVQLSALGGREICPAFAIYDGLSSATVVAIENDIQKSMALAGFKG